MTKTDVHFIYDGECPICNYAAHALRIRQDVGALHLIDARTQKDHPLVHRVNALGLDLDQGMVLFYADRAYHGRDALHFMALVGTSKGWFNRINALLFKSPKMSTLCYPLMRGARNMMLRIKGVSMIDNLDTKADPIFKSVFGTDWDKLPQVMHQHYANRPGHNDVVTVEGIMKVESSRLGRLMTPFFRLAGTLVPYEGDHVPATVNFISTQGSDTFQFDRTFYFPGKKPYRFHSCMKPLGGNELVEFMRFGLGWRMAYHWTGEKVVLTHRSYVLNLFGFLLPLPLALLMGKGYAEETPEGDQFSMLMEIRHPLWGKIYGYSGVFKVTRTL